MIKSFSKYTILCRYRSNEYKNKFSLEFCRVNYSEYAIFEYRNGDIKGLKIGTDYHKMKRLFKEYIIEYSFCL